MSKRIYVVSDIHGYYDLFIKLLEKINFNQDDLLYIIGDICDRGPDTLKLIFYIQKHDNIILLKGNHEYMMQEALYYGIYYKYGWQMAVIRRCKVFAAIYKKIS